MSSHDEEENRREAYRRGSDLDIRSLYVEAQRQSDMLIRHERELRQLRDSAMQNRTLILGAEGQGGMLGEVKHLSESIDTMTTTFSSRVDNIRTWAIGALLTFAIGALGIIATIIVATAHG